MIEIKDLLLKFNNLLISENLKIDALKEVLLKVINLKIKSEDIKIKNNIIYLNIKPIYKNEILIKKDKIFFELKNSLGKKTPRNII
ncbi:hypothetical protein COX93_01490 [Candidatus Nomurabacteria bacterium CG_4_10_14_0_2_um_filter_30_12]|uniref:Uncharacterized protein n=2 Tax=Candidatus Nomuraibacteriota TaxID=1752729 RepID=A0A2J0MNL9_9BACT|nr:MAG: hypothetical protein COU48_00495 [Candidatus Nomurabacteria bacterium CG10_big_fil_rev_8_21_14_0_10_03_31_7]PIZ87303.1 MAG: hypothetical protein COX93_01490 [Candidatus Nomurabacteria bacterium CG_4_10_14_0_2_um_filter_30_12]